MIISIFNKIKPKLSFSEQHIVNNKINQRKKDVNKLLSNFETEEIKINKLKTGRRTIINNRNSMFLNSSSLFKALGSVKCRYSVVNILPRTFLFSRLFNSSKRGTIPPKVMKAVEMINSSQPLSWSIISFLTLVCFELKRSLGLKSGLDETFSSMNAVLAPFKMSSLIIFINHDTVQYFN